MGKKKRIALADPLPPDGDSGRHSPTPGGKPSSPWEPGKSPAPSRKTLAKKKREVNNVNTV